MSRPHTIRLNTLAEISPSVESRSKSAPADNADSQDTVDSNDTNRVGDYSINAQSTGLAAASDLANSSNNEIVLRARATTLPSDFPTVFLAGADTEPDRLKPEGTDHPTEPSRDSSRPESGDGPPKTDPIKRDEQGRITEISYPNGSTRQFGYDQNGQLNRIVQPNGDVYVLRDGRWQVDESARPPAPPNNGNPFNFDTRQPPEEIRNPEIAADGTFTYRRIDGTQVRALTDGTSVATTRDGAVVTSNAEGRVTSIRYANGDTRQFEYDTHGHIIAINHNGQYSVVVNGVIHGADGRPTGLRDPHVRPDGTYTVTDENRNHIALYPDRTTNIVRPDRSVISRDADGRITTVTHPDNSSHRFDYDSQGRLTAMTDPDGRRFELQPTLLNTGVPTFRDATGNIRTNVQVRPDGTVTYHDRNDRIHTHFASGNHTETTYNAEQLRMMARLLYHTNWSFTDNTRIQQWLEGMSHADRVALDDQYRGLYGQTLSDHLRSQVNDPNKREASLRALEMLSESHLRTAVLQSIADPADQARANEAIDRFRERARQQGLPLDRIIVTQESALRELSGNNKPGERLRNIEKMFTDAAPTWQSIEDRYGVRSEQVTRPDGTTARRYYVEGENGERIPVLETTSDNPADVQRQLEEWREQRMQELERTHNIQLSRDGQSDVTYRGTPFDVRAPRIDELMALQRGLERSYPSTGQRGGQPILVQFAVRPTSSADAYVYQRRDNGQMNVVFEPMARDFRGLQDTIMHEWAHIAQHNMTDRERAAVDRWYAATGFREVTTADGSRQWQLRDKDGNYWAQAPRQGAFGDWTRVDEQGRPLRADGTLATGWDDPLAARRNNREMRDTAAVKPYTSYFFHPQEMTAEALMAFRGDERSRRELFETAPDLYWATKEFDQRELDTDPRYGTNPDGTSRFIRLPNGTIVENNQANQQIVRAFEEGLERARRERASQNQSGTTPRAEGPAKPEDPNDQSTRPQRHRHVPGLECPHCR